MYNDMNKYNIKDDFLIEVWNFTFVFFKNNDSETCTLKLFPKHII